MPDIFKAPSQCTAEEIEAFFQLLMTGNEVERQSAKNGVRRAMQLAFHYEGNVLAGIAAIKRPLESYRQSVFSKSKVSEQEQKFSLELGYAVTLQKYEGQGICSGLVSELVKLSCNNIFATTRTANNPMQRVLKKNGFHETGHPYKGNLQNITGADYFLQLFTREVRTLDKVMAWFRLNFFHKYF